MRRGARSPEESAKTITKPPGQVSGKVSCTEAKNAAPNILAGEAKDGQQMFLVFFRTDSSA